MISSRPLRAEKDPHPCQKPQATALLFNLEKERANKVLNEDQRSVAQRPSAGSLRAFRRYAHHSEPLCQSVSH